MYNPAVVVIFLALIPIAIGFFLYFYGLSREREEKASRLEDRVRELEKKLEEKASEQS